MTSLLFTQRCKASAVPPVPVFMYVKTFLKMEVLQTQITAMAAAGDAAQEKVFKLIPIHPRMQLE